MSVLIDTSIWIRFLSGTTTDALEVDRLLSADDVCSHEAVLGELLIGDRGGRQAFLAEYARIDRAPVVAHEEVVELVRHRRLHGRGIGWIDAHLLASALVGRVKLWTGDERLEALARELDVSYR